METEPSPETLPTHAPYPSPERFGQVFHQLEALIERRWELPVVIRDVPDPFTGDLDGAEIAIDYDLNEEDSLFILVHLFGHTVQWNVDPEARELGAAVEANPSPERLEAQRRYEEEACRYSLQLLHEAGVHDLDAWLADFSRCDFAYLEHFYRTGDKKDFRSFWRIGTPTLEPLAIPPFRPSRWLARSDGVVI